MTETVVRTAFPRISWRHGDYEDAQRTGAMGRNGFLVAWAFDRVPAPRSIIAQELAEWGWKHKRAALYAIAPVVALVAAGVLFNWLFALFAPTAYLAAWLAADLQDRESEPFGHAVSVVSAEEFGEMTFDQAFARHSRSLLVYDCFAGLKPAAAEQLIRKNLPAARRWLASAKVPDLPVT